jgi:phospholipid/cholesterol/gamma-HCH transport system substrate-binding protein
MSSPTNHWKLGAFVVGSAVLGVTVAALLTAQAMRTVTVSYTSYFDEAVTGLEVGSPVRFRGVNIGNVSAIDVAPDVRHVEVTYSLGVKVLKRLGLAGTTEGKKTHITVPFDLRVQIVSTGVTGTKFLQIDFFDTQGQAPPALPFPVPENFIPAMPSTMKNLEDAMVRAVNQLPEITRELSGMIGRVNAILDDLGRRGLAGKAEATLDGTTRLLASLNGKLGQLPVEELSRDARAVLTRLDDVLARLDGEDGLVSSAQRTSDSLGDLAGPLLQSNLSDSGRDVREAAVAVRELVEALQRDPDMLLKGKAKVGP